MIHCHAQYATFNTHDGHFDKCILLDLLGPLQTSQGYLRNDSVTIKTSVHTFDFIYIPPLHVHLHYIYVFQKEVIFHLIHKA